MIGEEEWRPIPLAPGYEASDQGRIRSFRPCRGLPVPRVLRPAPTGPDGGYRVVRIHFDGKWRTRLVHQLVLEAFVGPRPEGMTDVRHLNGTPSDNRLANVVYGTQSENVLDRVRHGTHHYAKRTHCKHDHEFTAENTKLRARKGRTYRECLTCSRAAQRRYAEKKAA